MSEVLYVTEDGLVKLKEELDQLRTVERPMISRLIADARDKGDLPKMRNMQQLKRLRECSR
jgi:transcription elongation factor GreA